MRAQAALDTALNHRWHKGARASVSQRSDLVVIRRHVAVADDVWHAAEVLLEHQGPERRCRKVIERRLWSIQVRVGNDSPDAGVNATLSRIEVDAHRHGTDLLVVANDYQFVGKDRQRERGDVRLARLVNNQHVKVSGVGVKGR